MSFIADKIVMEGLTFDDLLLVPAYSQVYPERRSHHQVFPKHLAQYSDGLGRYGYGHRDNIGHSHCTEEVLA